MAGKGACQCPVAPPYQDVYLYQDERQYLGVHRPAERRCWDAYPAERQCLGAHRPGSGQYWVACSDDSKMVAKRCVSLTVDSSMDYDLATVSTCEHHHLDFHLDYRLYRLRLVHLGRRVRPLPGN